MQGISLSIYSLLDATKPNTHAQYTYKYSCGCTHPHILKAQTHWHTCKWVNNSRWVIRSAHLLYTVRPHHRGNLSTSSPPTPLPCKASVSHPAAINRIALPQHKEKPVMHDGRCAVVAYRPCCIICCPSWLSDGLLFYSALWGTLFELLQTCAKKDDYKIWDSEAGGSQRAR